MGEYPTAEMIAAGVQVVWDFNPDSTREGHAECVVKGIFEAMMAAHPHIDALSRMSAPFVDEPQGEV